MISQARELLRIWTIATLFLPLPAKAGSGQHPLSPPQLFSSARQIKQDSYYPDGYQPQKSFDWVTQVNSHSISATELGKSALKIYNQKMELIFLGHKISGGSMGTIFAADRTSPHGAGQVVKVPINPGHDITELKDFSIQTEIFGDLAVPYAEMMLPGSGRTFLVTEHFDGDLSVYVKNLELHQQFMEPKDLQHEAEQIASGLNQLYEVLKHSVEEASISHTFVDLRPENIFVKREINGDVRLVVGDSMSVSKKGSFMNLDFFYKDLFIRYKKFSWVKDWLNRVHNTTWEEMWNYGKMHYMLQIWHGVILQTFVEADATGFRADVSKVITNPCAE